MTMIVSCPRIILIPQKVWSNFEVKRHKLYHKWMDFKITLNTNVTLDKTKCQGKNHIYYLRSCLQTEVKGQNWSDLCLSKAKIGQTYVCQRPKLVRLMFVKGLNWSDLCLSKAKIGQTYVCQRPKLVRLMFVKGQNWSDLCLSKKHPYCLFCELNTVAGFRQQTSSHILQLFVPKHIAQEIFIYS